MRTPRGWLTTGAAAKLAGVSQHTIIRHAEAGEIRFFLVPGTTHRRIIPASLAAFLRAGGVPLKPELPALVPTESAPAAEVRAA